MPLPSPPILPTYPRLPCRAGPLLTRPYPSSPCLPCLPNQTTTHQAVLYLPLRSVASPPNHISPAPPSRSAPRHNLPNHPFRACLISPRQTLPSHSVLTVPACQSKTDRTAPGQTSPHHTAPLRACPAVPRLSRPDSTTLACPAGPNRISSYRTIPPHACLSTSRPARPSPPCPTMPAAPGLA